MDRIIYPLDRCCFCEMTGIKSIKSGSDKEQYFYDCPVCGRYEISESELMNPTFDLNKTRSYMMYNGFKNKRNNPFSKKYYTTLDQKDIVAEEGRYPVHLDNDMVEAWYPRSLEEKVNKILLKIDSVTDYMGDDVEFNKEEYEGLLFVNQYKRMTPFEPDNKLSPQDCARQVRYILQYMTDNRLIEYSYDSTSNRLRIVIKPNGYNRLGQLLKHAKENRDVFVAMKYGDETTTLREAIKQGIRDAGYNPIVMDEVEHNDYIIPEMLGYIRKCKFMVVDLTYLSNGAYFEEGYAMGLGKDVVQLQKKDEKVHFDIAQKNALIWETESEVPEILKKRITATIE